MQKGYLNVTVKSSLIMAFCSYTFGGMIYMIHIKLRWLNRKDARAQSAARKNYERNV